MMELRTFRLRAPVLLDEHSSRGTQQLTIGQDAVTRIDALPSGVVLVERHNRPWLWVHGDNWGYVDHPTARQEDAPPLERPTAKRRRTTRAKLEAPASKEAGDG